MNSSYQTPNSKWLTEQCPVCCSVNHIFIPDDSYHAWECYHCQYRSWLDHICSEIVAIENGIAEYDADQALYCKNSMIKFCQGHYERQI
jgi:hypothetical protein